MSVPGGHLSRVRLPVRTARLLLRLPRPSDVPLLVRYLNDPDVFRPVFSRSAPLTVDGERGWVRDSRSAAARGTKLNLAVTLRATGELIGGVGLEIRDWDERRGWIGYWIAPAYWHRGYASEAASAVCRAALRLGLHRIDAAVFEFNPRSMRLLRRLGFRREGRRREIFRRDGRWYDEVAFGLLAPEFRPARAPGTERSGRSRVRAHEVPAEAAGRGRRNASAGMSQR